MKIKKVSQTTPTSAQVVDGYSTSTSDSYSCNYINNHSGGSSSLANSYTTGTDKAYTVDYINKFPSSLSNETKIGYVWDMSTSDTSLKLYPLYKKTITKVQSMSTGYTNIAHGISNINHVHFWQGRTLTNYQLPYYSSSGKISTVASVSRTNITMYCAESWGSNYTWVWDLYYTKTTDWS